MRIGVGFLKSGRRIPPELMEEARGIARSKLEWLAELLALAAIVAQIVLLTTQYSALPGSVPTHFGFDSLPDAYGAKSTLLYLLAGNIALYVMMTVMSFFPGTFNFAVAINRENLRRQVLLLRAILLETKVLVCWMFFYITYQAAAVALGYATNMGLGIWVFLGLILLTLPLLLALCYKWR